MDPGNLLRFTPPADSGSLVTAYDWLHIEGVTLPEAVNGPAVRELTKTASTNETAVAFDLNGRPKQWERPTAYRNAIEDILPYCSVVFAGTADLAVGDIEPTPAGLHEIEEKAHDFSRGMNPTTHDTISPR